jgi:hypothetical protein
VSAHAPGDGFSVELDLGGDYQPQTCSGPTEVCWYDGENTWCGMRPDVATCAGSQHVILDRTRVEYWIGTLQPDGCSDIYIGTIVPE